MTTVRRSLAYTFAESYLSMALQLVGTLFIARLLTPAETGVWAVASVFAAIASNFRDFGVGEYLIQEKDLTTAKLRAALAANIAVSWLMSAVLLAASLPVAAYYGQPGIANIMHVQCLNFLLIPFGAVTYAYFRRNLNYRPFFWASMISNVTTFVVALSLAFAGFGYMSLAWSSFAGIVVSVIVAQVARPAGFPRLPGLHGIGEVLHFGKHVTGIYLFGQIGKSAPELIIGRVLGMAPVGYFSRANGLTELFNRSVMRAALPVCLPYFAKVVRKGAELRDGYLRTVGYLTAIAWPFFLFLSAMAFPAVRILYGPQWLEAVPVARILCIVAAIEVVYFLATEALIANGDARSGNLLQAVQQALRIAGLLAAVAFGLLGACYGLMVAAAAGGVWAHHVLARKIGLTAREMIRTCVPSMVIALVSAAPALLWAAFGTLDEHNYILAFGATGVAFSVLWLATVRALRHPLWEELVHLRERFASRA